MTTQAMFENGLRCRGKGFNCVGCKERVDCVEYVNVEVKEKPPLGLTSKHSWITQRIQDIKDAINRYSEANYKIPEEWVKEYNWLIKLSEDQEE